MGLIDYLIGIPFGQGAANAVKSEWMLGDKKVNVDPNDAKLQGGEYMRDIAEGGIAGAQGRQAPQMTGATVAPVATANAANVDTAQQRQWRDRQLALADQLNRVAAGQEKGAGELAANRSARTALASQQAMARMGRGSNAALAARGAARNAADIGGQMAGQAREAALQDQASARAALAGTLQGARGADIGLSTAQAGLQQQVNLANMSAENQRIFQQAGLDQATSLANMESRLRTMGMNDQAILGYLSAMFGVDAAEMQARLEQDKIRVAQRGEGHLGDLLAFGGTMATSGAL